MLKVHITAVRSADGSRERLSEKSGTRTSSTRPRASPTCSTSISTWCTRSPRRRRSTGCAWPGGRVRAARPDRRDGGPQRARPTDIDQPVADPISAQADGGAAAPTRAEFGIPLLRDGRPEPGHRARHRSRAGAHAAGHDDRVRRQPHRPRTARSARSRSASARARSSTCSPRRRCRRRGRARWRSPSTASCPPASPPRTSCSPSSAASAPAAASARVIEYRGSAIRGLSMEGRMTRLQHVDRGRRPRRADRARRHDVRLPRGPRPRAAAATAWERRARRLARARHRRRRRRSTRRSSRRGRARARTCRGAPTRRRSSRSTASCPTPTRSPTPSERATRPRVPRVHGPEAGTPMRDIARRHRVHRLVHELAASRTCAPPPPWSTAARCSAGVRTLVVPGSCAVKAQAEAEGLDQVFTAAGFDWREPGCSMCLAMNPDKLAPGERCASTSNRNFEGRQGRGGRTHLVSPAVAAATAIAGHFATPGGPRLMETQSVSRHRHAPCRSTAPTSTPTRSSRRDWLKRVERTGFGEGPVLRVARRPRLRAEPGALRRRQDPRGRPELRHRLVAGARRVGAAWTTASRR